MRTTHSRFGSLLCLLFVLVNLCAMASAQAAKATKKPKAGKPATVVLVGNSYTHFHDLPAMLRALGRAAEPPRELTTVMLAPPGFTLEQHALGEDKDSTAGQIKNLRPDFVVLQEQSQRPFADADKMQRAAAELARVVKKAKAVPVWYMTWARQNEPERQDAISEQYELAQQKNGGELAPVGRAFQLLRAESDDLNLHMPDQSHPSPAGSYLAACVLYGAMFGDDVTPFPDLLHAEPDGKQGTDNKQGKVLVELAPADGERLRKAAAAALRGEKAPPTTTTSTRDGDGAPPKGK